MSTMSFGNCHVGVECRHGRFFFDVGIQYWTIFSTEISLAQAVEIMARYHEVEREFARTDARLARSAEASA